MTAYPKPGHTKIGYLRTDYIQVIGDVLRVDVYRDVSIRSEVEDPLMTPVEAFIHQHGLTECSDVAATCPPSWSVSGKVEHVTYLRDDFLDVPPLKMAELLPRERDVSIFDADELATVQLLSGALSVPTGFDRWS